MSRPGNRNVAGAVVRAQWLAARAGSMGELTAYAGLFFTALVAGTLLPFLPGSTELALAGLVTMGSAEPAGLVSVAVVGNTIGAGVNYLVGWNIVRLAGQRWFPLSAEHLENAAPWFRRYGIWAVAMCWVPTYGDAITVVAGALRSNLRLFLVLAASGRLFGHSLVASGVTWLGQ